MTIMMMTVNIESARRVEEKRERESGEARETCYLCALCLHNLSHAIAPISSLLLPVYSLIPWVESSLLL